MKCEGWIHNNSNSEESKIRLWLNRLIGQTQDAAVWPYPFAEGKLFVLTLRLGLEGYHVDIDGRHVSSFPHRAVSKIAEPLFQRSTHELILRLFANVHRGSQLRMLQDCS